MRQHLLPITLSLAVLFSAPAEAQTPVAVQFQTDPVLVQTGTDILFTVLTVPNVFTMTWQYQGGVTLGLWVNGAPAVNPVPQFQGRVTITATTLKIGSATLQDAGQYTVVVDPGASTGLAKNSKTATLNVYDAVSGVNLFVPTVSIEGSNISLTCTWTAGTQISVQWTKGGTTLTSSSRITISAGSLVINPAQRSDAGDYTCTVSNPVSARTATQSLIVYYGPDTPVLTKDTVKDCVGVGDVQTGKTISLTCTSASLPPALFSWQYNGQSVTTSQPNSGVLLLQTSSSSQSGNYTCTARNAVTGGTSAKGTNLVIVDVCLDVGEIVGIVIGSFILLILLIILIAVIARCILVRRRRGEAGTVQKIDANPRPTPANPQPNAARDLGQGPQPPLYRASAEPRRAGHLYTAPLPVRNGGPQTQAHNGPSNSNTNQHNSLSHTNGFQHNAIQNANSAPHNGIDNPAFTHAEVPNAPEQMQNPNILIQTGNAQVSLNTLPRTAQHNNNGQIPTIHVNLNSYSAEQTLQESVAPPAVNTTVNEATQTPQNTRQTSSFLRSPLLDRHRQAILQTDPGLIPTGYTHYNRNNTSQQNANAQTSEPGDGSESSSSQEPPQHQLPWDMLRGTPAYPSGTQRHQTRVTSDSTDYTIHPPIQQPQTRPQSQARTRQEVPADRRSRSNTRPRTEAQPHTQRETQREDMRGGRQSAPRQEVRRDNSPQAVPLMSHSSSAGHSLVSHHPDIRALADPNHLPQTQVDQQSRAAPVQAVPQPVTRPEPRQVNPAPAPQTIPLTQTALQTHTERSQAFQNRRQQTQAALLHPGPRAQQPPTPPAVIPLTQFQALPKERTRPRNTHPPKPPVNVPVAQRPHHGHQRHHTTMPPNHPHHHQPDHHPGHAGGQRQPHAHTWQQQAHRGRPR